VDDAVTTDDEGIEEEFRLLDEAILSLVGDNTHCTASELGVALDLILHGSLWARQLERVDSARQKLYTSVLYGRASIIWRDTTPEQRQAYHRGGLDLHAGLFLDSLYTIVAPLLRSAEKAIQDFDTEGSILALTALAEIIVPSKYFQGDERTLFVQWKEVVRTWLLGLPTANIVETCGEKAIDFIQDVLCYRLVWALEALRRRMIVDEPDLRYGYSAMALEFGTSNMAAALLMRLGLRSRVSAHAVVDFFRLRLRSSLELEMWLQSEQADDASSLVAWPTDEAHFAWNDFQASYSRRSRWRSRPSHNRVRVIWEGVPPEAGSEVRLFSAAPNVIGVYTTDLVRVGNLVGDVPALIRESSMGTVAPDAESILVERQQSAG
jgi:hypothetical protein